MTFPKLQAAIDTLTLIANGVADTEDRKAMLVAAMDLQGDFPKAAAYLTEFAHGTEQDTAPAVAYLQIIAECAALPGFMISADALDLIEVERQRLGLGLLETLQDLDYRVRDDGRTSDPVPFELKAAFRKSMAGFAALFAPV